MKKEQLKTYASGVAKNFAAGAVKRLHDNGSTFLRGVSAGAGYVAKKATGSDFVGKALNNSVSRGQAIAENKLGARSRTLSGKAGKVVVDWGPSAAGVIKGAMVINAARKAAEKATRSGISRLGAQTKKYDTPRRGKGKKK